MANVIESSQFDAGVYQIETEDPVLGGPDGIANKQAKNLANRTKYLKDQLEDKTGDATTTKKGIVELATNAEVLTGTDTVRAVTPAGVAAKIAALVNSSPAALDTLNELATALGNDPNFATTINNAIAAKAPTNSPALTGTPTAPTPPITDVSDKIATMAALAAAVKAADIIARFTTTANITLSGLGTQAGGDWGAALTVGDLILVKDQAGTTYRGWYTAASGAWSRVAYLDDATEVKASNITKVSEGVTLADTIWMLTTNAPLVIGTTGLAFAQKDGATLNANNFSGEQNIDVSSSSPALRVTQRGSGDVARFEDETNPDSTPVIIDADGNIIGGSSVLPNQPYLGSQRTPALNLVGLTTDKSALGLSIWQNANTTSPVISLAKSKSGTVGTFGVNALVANLPLGAISFAGDDGVKFVQGAEIVAQTDGIISLNSMPTRLVFATTPDGGNSAIERIRVDNKGRSGFAVVPLDGAAIRVGSAGEGTSRQGIRIDPTIPAGVTSAYDAFFTNPATEAAAFTLGTLSHFFARQNSLGAGSVVTNVIGFNAGNTLTQGVNNYGFYGNIPAASGRWNLYMPGTANNYLAGSLITTIITAPTLFANNQSCDELTSNTKITTKVRGTDGTTRSIAKTNLIEAADDPTFANDSERTPSTSWVQGLVTAKTPARVPVNELASRSSGVTYTNSLPYEIYVSVSRAIAASNQFTITVDGIVTASANNGFGDRTVQHALFAVVPAGKTYVIGGGGTITNWVETK